MILHPDKSSLKLRHASELRRHKKPEQPDGRSIKYKIYCILLGHIIYAHPCLSVDKVTFWSPLPLSSNIDEVAVLLLAIIRVKAFHGVSLEIMRIRISQCISIDFQLLPASSLGPIRELAVAFLRPNRQTRRNGFIFIIEGK